MRLSRYFLPILKENPREAEIVSHRLMLRAGMIRQQGQGSFSWLPLGKRVLEKVNRIIREEQDRAGALEILMPTIQSADLCAKVDGTTPTARRCCASRIARSENCFTVRPMRRW